MTWSADSTGQTSWRQRLLLVAFGLALAFALLVAAEWLLSLFGVDGDRYLADPYVGFEASSSLFERVDDGGPSVWRTRPEKLGFFNEQEFLVDKPAGAVRVFTLGGSTTAGRPYDDHVSFSRWLQRFLDQAEPNRQHEVVNAGAISYASYRVARLMEELTRYQPDLFVVLTGHNEFLEERTYRRHRAEDGRQRWLRSRLANLRLARVSWGAIDDRAAVNDAPATTLAADVTTRLEVWNGVQSFRRDDVQRDAVVEHFSFNLERMTDLARQQGIPILFIVPASNIKDFSPFKSEHGDAVSPADAAAVEALSTASDLQAIDDLRSAVATDPLYADGWYRLGRAELGLNRFEAALAAFEAARETDVAPLRAIGAIVSAVRALGKDTLAKGVIDLPRMLEDELEASAGHRILGNEHFLDHVHPNLSVHRSIAEQVLSWMAEAGLVTHSGDPAARDAIFDQVTASLDRDYYARRDLNLAKVLGWAGKLEEAEAPLLRASEVLTDEPALHLALGTLRQKQGRHAKARQHLDRAVELLPSSPEAHFNLAVVEARLGQLDDAATRFETALSLRSEYPEALFNLALVRHRQGAYPAAIRRLEAARALSPSEWRVVKALAAAHRESGQVETARQLLATELAGDLPPTAARDLRLELAISLAQLGDLDQARALIDRVLSTTDEPVANALRAEAHYVSGRLFAAAGDRQSAADSYSRTLDLAPEHVPAHNNLAILLASSGHLPDAIARLQRAIELDPAYAEAYLNLAVVLDRSAQPSAALRATTAALELRANDPRIRLAHAMLLIELGRSSEARPHLEQVRAAGLRLPEQASAVLEPAG